MKKFLAFLPLLLPGLLTAPAAHSWQVWHHQVTAEIAERFILPGVREDVRYLLGPRYRMADEAGWADYVRGFRRWTGPWHYLNWPLDRKEPDFDVFSAPRGNVVSAIEEQLRIYRDRTKARRERREALKFVVHFVGDVHQPLHVGIADDRGGNDVPVLVGGKLSNLHAAWDGGIYDDEGDSPAQHAAGLLEGLDPEDRDRIMAGRPYDWALESHRFTREFVYPRLEDLAVRNREGALPELSGPYADAARPIIRRRLLEAGLRLAHLLNEASRDEHPPAPEEAVSPPPAAPAEPAARGGASPGGPR